MKKIRTRDCGIEDIRFKKLYCRFSSWFNAIVVVMLALTLLMPCIAIGENKEILRYNEQVAEFNAKPLAERKIIADWTRSDEINFDTYTMTGKELIDLRDWASIYCRDDYIYVMLVFVAILSFCIFFSYADCCMKYYLCSLPFYRSYGWVLFFCMFVGWPFLLGSLICMLVERTDSFKEYRKRRALAKQEKIAAQRLTEDELAKMARQLTEITNPKCAHQALVNYMMERWGKDCKECAADAEREWEVVKNVRGVSSIKYDRNHQCLKIVIKRRILYEGGLYDLGDYRLMIDGKNKCSCRRIHSGVKLSNTTYMTPLEDLADDQFDFGRHLSSIEGHLEQNRCAEAVTLASECLHTIESEYEKSQIPEKFRELGTIKELNKQKFLRRITSLGQRWCNMIASYVSL